MYIHTYIVVFTHLSRPQCALMTNETRARNKEILGRVRVEKTFQHSEQEHSALSTPNVCCGLMHPLSDW